ncbi:MAG: DsrE/DsrF/DrsH-like family protein [Polyangiaceae bacterium]|jgi:peroxiredoxin family protein/TusA-related sulfurtransferase|nr:DsrE/DsrF/DrsH-like family protein [Polyangiaceae bacterium]
MQTTLASVQAEISLDCRGLQCPAPILKLADTARQHRGKPTLLRLQATDPDFLTDLEAWCRTTKSRLLEHREEGGVIHALVALHGAAAPAATAPAPAAPVAPAAPASAPSSGPGQALDLRGLPVNAAMRRLSSEALQGGDRRVRVLADAPEFEGRLYAWATASGAKLERVLSTGGQVTADVMVLDEEGAPPPSPPAYNRPASALTTTAAATPAALASLAAQAAEPAPPADLAPRENMATLLVLRNDYEALLSALMVANSSASQGMNVEVYFAFWGINLLRGETRRPSDEKQPGFLQRMMRWMMPRGPRRQKLSKMNWGGVGKFMLELFMKQRNVLSLEQLMEEAARQNVQFKVCSMSMGVMGIQRADLMELPNLSFGGVTSFSEAARRSSFSLVF